jgi:hypothetical protein
MNATVILRQLLLFFMIYGFVSSELKNENESKLGKHRGGKGILKINICLQRYENVTDFLNYFFEFQYFQYLVL